MILVNNSKVEKGMTTVPILPTPETLNNSKEGTTGDQAKKVMVVNECFFERVQHLEAIGNCCKLMQNAEAYCKLLGDLINCCEFKKAVAGCCAISQATEKFISHVYSKI